MGAVAIQQMVDRVSALMEERLGVDGSDLSARLARGGGWLPPHVRRAAKDLVRASEMARDPVTLLQIDMTRVSASFDTCVKYLGRRSRTGLRLRRAAGAAVVAAICLAALAVLVVWAKRGG